MKPGSEKLAIIVFAHGSVVEEANQGAHDLASRIRSMGPFHFVRASFLDCAHPNLGEAIDEAVRSGAKRVIFPYFLTMGIRLRRDLPNLFALEKEKHPQVAIDVGQPLEGHPMMGSIILEHVAQALRASEGGA